MEVRDYCIIPGAERTPDISDSIFHVQGRARPGRRLDWKPIVKIRHSLDSLRDFVLFAPGLKRMCGATAKAPTDLAGQERSRLSAWPGIPRTLVDVQTLRAEEPRSLISLSR